MSWILLIVTVIFTAVSQIVLKWRLNSFVDVPEEIIPKLTFYFIKLFDPYVFSSFLFAFLGSLTYMAALQKVELNVAYPFMSLSYVLVFVISYVVFSEPISMSKILGLGFILIGILFISLGK